MRRISKRVVILLPSILLFSAFARGEDPGPLPQSVVIEAENMAPLRGGNFSFQQVDATTKGSWSLAGPGVAAEWTQGGESEFLSIAARADEPAGTTVSRDIEMPAAGAYTVWVRYADYRKKREDFGVRVSQGGKEIGSHVFGTKPLVDELDPMIVLWDFAFTWDKFEVPLQKGLARLELYTTGPTEARRHVDLLVLTTDAKYQPTGREKPDAAAWNILRSAAKGTPLASANLSAPLPPSWKITDKPPAFAWNVSTPWMDELKRGNDRIESPFGVDGPLLKDFSDAFRGKAIPIYGSRLGGPTWHIPVYPAAFADGSPFLQWLDRHPEARFTILLNYGAPAWPEKADKQKVYANFKKYQDRFIGYVAGESIAHESYDSAALDARVKTAKTRGEILAALRDVHTQSVVKKFTDYYGTPVTPAEAWAPVMSCLSAGNEAYCHALLNWGCKHIGHENTGNSPTLARRLAFLRGAARQFGAKITDYQSANLGDSATMFSRESYFYPASSKYILDNSYDAWAGAGTNWLLKDYTLFYLAGCDCFYNEQGVDMFWKPGGGAAGDGFSVQLSPKGKVAEAVINLAENHPRGAQYTPIAFLLDEAHGYSQERFQPASFGMDPQLNPALLTSAKHEAALRGWFDIAYFPAPDTQNEPASAIRQTYVSSRFGDIFDVVVTAPDKADIVKTYPVLIAAGDVPLTEPWGAALKGYVEAGGTLVVCADAFSGPGMGALALPPLGAEAEADTVTWKPTGERFASNVFRFKAIPGEGADILATTAGGRPIAIALKRGGGKLIFVAAPLGLGIDNRPVPILSLLMRDLASGLAPVQVDGEVERIYNRLDDGGWLVTLLNNRGVIKPQHGMLPTDYGQAATVTLSAPFKVKSAAEWMAGCDVPFKEVAGGAAAQVTVPAGAVRIVAIQPAP